MALGVDFGCTLGVGNCPGDCTGDGNTTAPDFVDLSIDFGFQGSARAGVTYDFAFRSMDITGAAIAGSLVSGGGHTFDFSSPAAANACKSFTGAGCPVLDVLLITNTPLFSASVSVSFDDANGLSAGFAQEWFGQGVIFNMMTVVVDFSPLGGLACGATRCSSFDGVIVPPNGPPSLPVGTYHIGTIIWDTSSLSASISAVMTEVVSGIDATGGVVSGIKTSLTGSEGVAMGFIGFNLIPEPATAALLALGLGGLGALARRRRG